MKIETIQVSQNIPKQEKSDTIDPKEFSRLLTEASNDLTKEDDALVKGEKEDNSAMQSLMGGLFNLPIMEDKSLDNLSLVANIDNKISIEPKIQALNEQGITDIGLGSLGIDKSILSHMETLINNDEGLINKDMSKNEEILPIDNKSSSNEEIPLDKNTFTIDESLKAIGRSDAPTQEIEASELDIVSKEDVLNISEGISKELSLESDAKEKTIKTETKDSSKEINLLDRQYFTELRTVTAANLETQTELPEVNLQRIEDSIVELMETTTEGNTNILKVKLYPEDLGAVDVTLKMEEGKLTAKILVDNNQIKDLFTNKLNELNDNLIKQNIHIEKINVDLNISNTGLNLDLNQHGTFNQHRRNFRAGQLRFLNSEIAATSNTETMYHGSSAISILA